MHLPGVSLSFSSRVLIFAGALCLGFSAAGAAGVAGAVGALDAAESEPPLRIAVARFEAPSPCAGSASSLGSALADSLRARGIEAIADTTLASWLRRLDATRFPDPADFARTREYLSATGARRLVYVNDIRWTEACALVFEAALWNTEPLGRKATRHAEAAGATEAVVLLAETLEGWLRPRP